MNGLHGQPKKQFRVPPSLFAIHLHGVQRTVYVSVNSKQQKPLNVQAHSASWEHSNHPGQISDDITQTRVPGGPWATLDLGTLSTEYLRWRWNRRISKVVGAGGTVLPGQFTQLLCKNTHLFRSVLSPLRSVQGGGYRKWRLNGQTHGRGELTGRGQRADAVHGAKGGQERR